MVTDAEIQEIVEANEAGVADVIEAYELAEARYMNATLWTPEDSNGYTVGSTTS